MAERAEQGAWTGVDKVLFALLAATATAGLAFLVHPWFDRTNDASVYVLTAQALGRGEGYTYLGMPFVVRPPGLSALIVPFVGGEGGPDFRALNLFTSALGAAAVLLLYAYARPLVGGPAAFGAALALWALPGFQRLASQTLSDVPGLTALLASLLAERAAARRSTAWREVLLGVLIAAGTYLRTVLFVLVPAVALARLLRGERRARRLALFAATAAVLVLPWGLRNRAADIPAPADQTRQISNGALFWHVDPGDPTSERFTIGEVLARVPVRCAEGFRALGRLELANAKEGGEDRAIGPARAALAALLLAAIAYSAARYRRAGELYLLASLALLSVFPTVFLDRYALPFFALGLVAAAELARDALRPLAGAKVARLAPAALLVAAAALAFEPRADWDEIERRHARMRAIADDVAAKLEPDARLAAEKGWHLAVYLGRPVYTLRQSVRRHGMAEGVERVIDRYGLNTVIVLENQRDYAGYLARRYPERLRRAAESTMIARVRD